MVCETTNERCAEVGRIEGRLDVLRRWIASLPGDSELAVELAEEFRLLKGELLRLRRRIGEQK